MKKKPTPINANPKKKRTLGTYIVHGAKLGSTLGATYGTLRVLNRLPKALTGTTASQLSTPAKILGTSVAIVGNASAKARLLGGTGALIGAGAYGVSRLLNKKKEQPVITPLTRRKKIMNAYKQLTLKS